MTSLLQGLSHLLDNHLSHPLMKAVFPQLKNVLHDTSEKVRVLFIDLLIKVKGIRAIKVSESSATGSFEKYHLLVLLLRLTSSCIVSFGT